MARLIPRKQIEEQQNISGSLTIQDDLIVGRSIFASGTLQVDNDYFLGDNLNDRGEITGSVFLTGSLTIDGNFEIVGENFLNLTASNALASVDTQRYAGILAKDFGANLPTLYVSSTDGDDTNDGRTIQYPLRTIKRAAQLASPGYDGRYGFDTGSLSNGYVIKVQAGTYLEENPVILPANTTIWGAGLRITKINAKNPTEDLFHVNSGCYVAEVTMGGLRLFPDQINPERGFAIAFQPGAFITTSPYTQNCSQISNQENSFTELYEDIPPGGGGLYVNGDVIHPDSPLASMVLDAYTQISPNGVGCLVNGRGFIQLVSFFTNFSYYAIRVNNGGHATLNNSNISFGLYGMYASGSRFISGSGGNIAARDSVRGTWSCVVDVLNKGLADGLPETTILNTAEGIRATSLLQYPQLYLSGSEVNLTPTLQNVEEVKSDFKLVSAIVESGTSNFPTLLARSSNKGYGFESPYNILGAEQITSSLTSASQNTLTDISKSFGALLGIFANGTGSFDFISNTQNAIKVTELEPTQISMGVSNSITASVSSSFQTVISIISNGLNARPKVTSSNEAAIKVSNVEQFTTGISSSLQTINKVSASFSIIYNILDRGTGSVILPIPEDHIRNYTITNNDSSSYEWEGVGSNPTITLYRGETYKLYVSASNVFGGINYPFFIRTQPLSGISEKFDYDKGVINNGDSVGNITFTVPYDAPNELYYVAQNTNAMSGKFHIINNSATPFNLIANTLTYPQTISGSVTASNNIDILNAYELLTENIPFIEEETIEFVSSSWSDFEYNEETCRRDIGFLINAVADDLLFGGNNNSITAGRFYYEYPSTATTTQKDPTKTAVKYAAGMAQKLLKDVAFAEPTNERDAVANAIKANREFIQNETITYLSSSWSNFYYNEAKCKRDVGYILDAVATDARYGGNERSVQAGEFYYLYPSLAIVEGDGDSEGQLGQTLDGIRFAAGNTINIVAGITHETASLEIRESYRLLRENKELIQNETIQFINVAYPQLKYNQDKCKRDVGYIIDAISTDLLYGGIERSVIAGKYYYEYPSQATRTQRIETSGGIRYSKIISDFIVQNTILETPRIITNDERLLKVTNLTNTTSSFSGTITEQNSISSSFAIIEGIIKRGTNAVPSILAQNNGQNWNINNPINVSGLTQITSSTSSANLTSSINDKFAIVTKIIDSGSLVAPAITSSIEGLIKVTNIEQVTGSVGTQIEANLISSSFATIVRIITNGTGSIPSFISNTISAIKVTDAQQWTGSSASNVQSTFVSSSIVTITNIIENGLDVVPTLVPNTSQSIKVTNVPQISSSLYFASSSDVTFISQSISYVSNIIEFGTGSVITASLYTNATTSSNIIGVYNLLKENIPFIQAETIAYLSSSWQGFEFNDISCSRDIGLIISGAAEDLYWNTNSSSIVNGKYYLEFPSQATSSQLNQTLDGIEYASRIAQKIIQNVKFIKPSSDVVSASLQLLNNKHFIQSESIAYLSSSWGEFEYNDQTCKRDVGYIVDAVRTDLVYGGNERSITAGEYYYLYPSDATGSQLIQTLDGINYASRVAQNVVIGTLYQTASLEKQNADFLLNKNKQLISNEVVEYVSSSWFSIPYNETKCKRDVRYIIDAVRTDLVYGGNERSRLAGEFYYKFPSSATVGGVPSVTNQLDPTITGIEYGNQFAQKIVLGNIFTTASNEALNVNKILQQNRNLIKAETIQYISAFYPYLVYNEASCSRDVGFILDGISTDILYGGNERSVTAGTYYYKFPSVATSNSQKRETIDSINYFRNIVKNIVSNEIIDNSEFVSNIDGNIKVGNIPQITSSLSATNVEVSNISSSFVTVTQIIEGGLTSIPTIVSNNESLIKVTSEAQITSAVSASSVEVGIVTASFGLIRDIIYWGSASLPDSLASNFQYGFEKEEPTLLRISSFVQTTGSGIYNEQTSSVSSSFGNIINVINNGVSSIPTLEANTSASVTVNGIVPITSTISGSDYEKNRIGNLFGIVMNIIDGGRNSIPTLIGNTSASIKVTNTPQIISGSASDRLQARLVSSSFGMVIDSLLNNGTSSVVYVGPSGINTNPKITSAYNLLLDNQQFIIDETITYMSSSWSTFDYNQTKCERDLGLIISGAAFDLLWGGNSASLVNGKFYFESASQANSTQLDQTLTAIGYAGRIAARVVRNTPLVYAELETSASYVSLIKNKGFIQSESISYVSSSWEGFEYNEASCSRDIGYIVDAVATDLLYGGNERSIIAGRYYYDFPSQATSTQLEQTLTGVRYAKGTSMNVVVNKQFFAPNADNQTAYNLIKDNKEFVQEETVAFVNAKYPELDYIEDKCKRDVGFIVDAVATDLLYGGNERSNKAGEFYYLYPSLATENEQVVETTTAVDYARRLTQEVINSNVIPTPQIILNTTNNIKVTDIPQYVSASSAGLYEQNKVSSSFAFVSGIVENGLGYISTFVSNVSESVKFTNITQNIGISATQTEATIISSSINVVTDIITNGTGSLPTTIDYITPSTDPNVINAYNNLRNNIEFIQNETIAYLSSSWSGFEYIEDKCKRDVGLIISGAAEDLIWNSNSASIQNGYYYWLVPSQAPTAQLNQTLDGIKFASRMAQKIVLGTTFVEPTTERKVASELLKLNKSFIQSETITYISSSWVTGSNSDSAFIYNEASCSRDVGFILDAVATDIIYGGNERTIEAGRYYFLYPSQATGSQLDETLDGIRYAGQLAEKVIVNTLFVTASSEVSASYVLMKQNKDFIQSETIEYVNSSWADFSYNEDKCRRDVGLLVDAVATDLLYGGNERSAKAGLYYFLYPSSATGSQLEPTVDAIDYAAGLGVKVIQSLTFVTASKIVSASVELLRNNREFIQEETMQYLTASWSTFDYNKEKCRRDVGYIVDGVATDLLYGGNERSAMSGEFYYRYPSEATTTQVTQTNEGINFASRVAQKVVQNIVFQSASLEASASFDLLRKNKSFIQAEGIAYVSSSWSTVYYNEASCSRDIGFLVDAAATDVLYGGQERAVTAGTYYYLFPSKATVAGVPSEANQLDPTITGVKYAGRLATKVVINPTYTQASGSAIGGSKLLQLNKSLIQKETITFLSSSWSTLQYNEISCSRDVGFIIDAVRTDLVYGGNERSIEAGSYYYKIPSVAIKESYTDNGDVGQKKQTVDGVNYAGGVSEKIVAQIQLVRPGQRRIDATNRLRASKDELKQRAIGYTNGAFPYLVYNEASCSRDTGLIVDACATDLFYGGNERGIAAASSYFNGQFGNADEVIFKQRLETLETNRYLRTKAEFIAAGAPLEAFGSLIVATGIDYSYNGSGVTFKALPPNQGGSGVPNPDFEITELGGGRIFFTSGNQDGDFRIGTGLSINQATGTLVGRTFSKSLFSLVTPFSLALQI